MLPDDKGVFEKELGLSQTKPGSVAKIYTVDAAKMLDNYGTNHSGGTATMIQ